MINAQVIYTIRHSRAAPRVASTLYHGMAAYDANCQNTESNKMKVLLYCSELYKKTRYGKTVDATLADIRA